MSAALLTREEYIEQAYFFRVFRERLLENVPAQEVLGSVREEILATTRLPMAIDFLLGELRHKGRISEGMFLLPHYFSQFQAFVISKAEEDEAKFDMRVALEVLEKEAAYRTEEQVQPAALFIYQFECIARNKLGYDGGMKAMAADPFFNSNWRDWMLKIRLQLGAVDFADLIYVRSEHYLQELRKQRGDDDLESEIPLLFGVQAGRIAKANRGKDPLYMFAALQRQLGYPAVPRPKPVRSGPLFPAPVEQRFQRIETRLTMIEQEAKGTFDPSQFLGGSRGEGAS
jgi:hypothetical protein